MKAGARVLISDYILPEPNTLPLLQERKVRYSLLEASGNDVSADV